MTAETFQRLKRSCIKGAKFGAAAAILAVLAHSSFPQALALGAAVVLLFALPSLVTVLTEILAEHSAINSDPAAADMDSGSPDLTPADRARQKFRKELREPSLIPYLLAPFVGAGVVLALLLLESIVSKALGITTAVAGALIYWVTIKWGERKGVTLQMMQEEIELYEASIDNPRLAAFLTKFEFVLFIVAAFVLTPSIARSLLPGKGSVGFEGILFLGAGFFISILLCASLAALQSGYIRDSYRIRLLIDGSVLLWIIYRIWSWSG